MYTFKTVKPNYTGGGIYVFFGQLDAKRYFMACDAAYDVRILDANPDKDESDPEYEDVWYEEWQESHLIEDLQEKESLQFFEDMIEWIKTNQPQGNYDMEEVLMRLDEIKELKGTENWR